MKKELIEIRKKYEDVMVKLSDVEVMSDISAYQKLAREQKRLEPLALAIEALEKLEERSAQAQELLREKDEEILELARLETQECESGIERLREEIRILLLPKDERDEGNVIMEIRPAAGGDEAALFAMSLLRMYTMYATSIGFRVEINDINETEIGGLKDVSLMIIGDGAFSKFKFESGVHRVQRVPDTETQGRIHTSTATVAVLPEATHVDFKIEEKDIRIDVYRASGAGGQHVNKTESAVRITHLPTGTVVSCQDNRSQIKNRERAMVILQAKLADYYQEQADKEYASTRKSQVGTGDRSERIRTYNFPQGRVTDHRIGKTVHNIHGFMNGEISAMVDALKEASQAATTAQ